MIRRAVGLMAAVVLATIAAVGLSGPFSPAAQAAYCTGTGVGVLIDFGDLGGGVSTGCGTGSKAAAAFTSAGVSLESDPKSPGFICRVQGKPDAGDQCLATNAYWALFVSKRGGGWRYASQGVYTQPVSVGDSVAFVWQASSARTTPGTAPQPATSPSPSTAPATPPKATAPPRPARIPKSSGKAKPARAPSPSPSPSVSATTSVSAGATISTATSPSASGTPADAPAATSSPSVAVLPSSAPVSTDTAAPPAKSGTSHGLPTWLLVLLIVVLGAAAAVTGVVRRRVGR